MLIEHCDFCKLVKILKATGKEAKRHQPKCYYLHSIFNFFYIPPRSILTKTETSVL